MDNFTVRQHLILYNNCYIQLFLFLSLSSLMEQTGWPVASALPATPQTLAVQSQTDHIILLGLRYFTYEKTLCRPTTVARMIVMKTGIQKRKNSVCAGMNSWRRPQNESWKKWASSGWNVAGWGSAFQVG